MRTTFQTGVTIMGGCAIAAVFWAILAAPGFLSEQDTVTHAAALTMLTVR